MENNKILKIHSGSRDFNIENIIVSQQINNSNKFVQPKNEGSKGFMRLIVQAQMELYGLA